jgi:excisionase family DNA binding protein
LNRNNPQSQSPSTAARLQTPYQLTRFVERRRAQKLGFELPLTTREAADYVGLHPKTVERMARAGAIPAHPVSGVRRKTWKFYATELDSWLRSKVHSLGRPCSPDGKDKL